MITTRDINVNLETGERKLRGVTTKNLARMMEFDALTIVAIDELMQGIPEAVTSSSKTKSIKSKMVSTHNMPDIKAIKAKEERDEIMAETKAVVKTDEEGLKKLNMQFVFVETDEIVQCVSRRELK